MSYIVLDLETVLDSRVPVEPHPSELARMLDAVVDYFGLKDFKELDCDDDPSDAFATLAHVMHSKREETFPQVACWQIASAAVVMLSNECWFEGQGIIHGETERDVVRNLASLCGRGDVLVTWNGRHFDVPVLEARCLRYGIPLQYFTTQWRYRYNNESHYDVKDYLASYGAVGGSAMSLSQASKLIGLPGKPEGVDGGKVGEMIAQGRLAEVQAYNLSDVVQTAGVLIRTELLRGRLTVSEAQEAGRLLLEACEKDERVRWVADKTDRQTFLLEESRHE